MSTTTAEGRFLGYNPPPPTQKPLIKRPLERSQSFGSPRIQINGGSCYQNLQNKVQTFGVPYVFGRPYVKLGVPYPDVLTIVVRTLVQTWIPCSLFMEALRASPSRPGRKNLGSGGTVTQYRDCNSFNRDNIGTTKGIKGVMLCNAATTNHSDSYKPKTL